MSGALRMLLQSCVIAVAVLVVLSSLLLLKLRYGKLCSGNYQPRAMTCPDVSVMEAEMPESDGLHTLAASICFLAAGAHSKDPAHQEQLGSALYDLCLTGCEGIRVDPAVAAFVDGMLSNKAKKK